MGGAVKLLLLLVLLLVALVALLWLVLPREPVVTAVSFDAAQIGPDVDAYLAGEEAKVADLRPGTQKRVIWAGAAGERTPLAIVYVHGYSATSEEVRPLPDLVAQALGANLYFTRFTGHGRSGEAMAEATVEDWMRDMAEALAVAERIGERTVILATSTGATLTALALNEHMGEGIDAAVFISPNFRVQAAAARILTWPGVRIWGPLVAGKTRSFPVRSEAHGRYWTTSYPTEALAPMAAAVQAASNLPYERFTTPVMMITDPQDGVVDPQATAKVAARWGGPVLTYSVSMRPEDDIHHHVIAGDILSPTQTKPMAETVIHWLRQTLGE